MSLLSVSHLSAGYGHHRVLHDLSFEVNEHEVFGIVGPNGSGKSTLVRVITGVMSYTGSVEYHGVSLSRLSRRDLARMVAVVSQSPHAPPWMCFRIFCSGVIPIMRCGSLGFPVRKGKGWCSWQGSLV